MTGQSQRLKQKSLDDIPSVIFSRESESGHMHYDRQDGQTIDQSGPAVVHASHSARQADKKGFKMKDTSGPCGSVSFASQILTASLGSKLLRRQELRGSTLFRLTSKVITLNSGLQLPVLQASAHPTSGKESTSVGWPTPLSRDWKGPSGRAWKGQAADLPMVALQAENWPQNLKGTVSGPGQTGFPLKTARGVQLNPAHSRWLMGLPPEWDDCAVMAMGSVRRRRKPS